MSGCGSLTKLREAWSNNETKKEHPCSDFVIEDCEDLIEITGDDTPEMALIKSMYRVNQYKMCKLKHESIKLCTGLEKL